MNITTQRKELLEARADVVIIGQSKSKKLNDYLAQLDEVLGGPLKQAMNKGQFEGDAKQTFVTSTLKKLPFSNLLVVGLGESPSIECLRKAAGSSVKWARSQGFKTVALLLHNEDTGDSYDDKVFAVAEAAGLALYKFDKFKHEENKKELDEIHILESDAKLFQVATKQVKDANIVANATNTTRDVANGRAMQMTPTKIGEICKQIARKSGFTATVYDKKAIKKLGLTALLAVNQGSAEEPRFIVLDYNKGAKKSFAFVGKGVTFDSGGLNIKTSWIEEMYLDKSGAAAVIGIVKAAAELKLPHRVIGVLACTENMPGAAAYKPSDIVTSYSGKTIEIGNTDAEGRVCLADALAFTEKKLKPNYIVDLATLTGACLIALGHEATGMLGTDDELMDALFKSGEKTNDKVWKLPLYDYYNEDVKSKSADVRNIQNTKMAAGCPTAAAFLSNFVEHTPWVHLDIAGSGMLPKEREYHPVGGSGAGVRVAVDMLRNWKK